MSIVLENPTPDLVRNHIFSRPEQVQVSEEALEKLFQQFPSNTNLDEVLLKVAALNSLYSTSIYGVYAVARHITQLGIDDRLMAGSGQLVPLIAQIVISGKSRTNYSFATKYCSWHKPDLYPIYDSFVDKLLWAYKKRDSFTTFYRQELWSYHRFAEIIDAFQTFYGLEQFTYRELDKFLWSYGKMVFPAQQTSLEDSPN